MIEIALLIGGAIGGGLRMIVEMVVPTPGLFPLGTLAINLGGTLVLGFFYELADHRRVSPLLRAGFGTGLIGAFTTFSTYCLETYDLIRIHWLVAVLYGVGSLVGGLLFAAAGQQLAERLLNRASSEGEATT